MTKALSIAALLLAAQVSVAHISMAWADDVEDFYKGKTLYALVGVSAGGEYDFQLRLVVKHIGRFIPGHPTVVAQNMTGATGMVMANYLYKVAPKDGTYIGLIQNGLPASQAVGMEGIQFDATKFNWLGSIAPTNETMVSWKTTGVKTIEDARKNELIAGAVGSSGVTLSLPIMLNDLAGTKFKMVMGYSGSGQIDIAMERGEVSARASSWSSLKTAKPDWIANKDINILVYTGPKPPDLSGVPAVDDVVKNPEDRKVVDVVMVGDKLGHPFATSPDVPPERVEALRRAFVEMEKDPAFLADAANAKLDVNPVSVETLKTAVDDTLNATSAVKARARKYFQ